nr:hypothetical protein [Tanacetum cinerariifolium]
RHKLPKQLAVGPKGHRPVQKQAQLRPHVGDVVGAGQRHHAAQQHHHPGGHAGQHPHILGEHVARDAVDFLFPFIQQGQLQGRGAQVFGPAWQTLHDEGRHIAGPRRTAKRAGRVGAAEAQGFALQQPVAGVEVGAEGQHVAPGAVVVAAQRLGGERDKLAARVGGAAAFGLPARGRAGP